jgi:hypothetical protein
VGLATTGGFLSVIFEWLNSNREDVLQDSCVAALVVCSLSVFNYLSATIQAISFLVIERE